MLIMILHAPTIDMKIKEMKKRDKKNVFFFLLIYRVRTCAMRVFALCMHKTDALNRGPGYESSLRVC